MRPTRGNIAAPTGGLRISSAFVDWIQESFYVTDYILTPRWLKSSCQRNLSTLAVKQLAAVKDFREVYVAVLSSYKLT